jgi:ribosomal protein L37AE/L43A
MPEKTLSDQRTDTPIRVCDKCNANMALLSDLPKCHDHAATKILRCDVCNNVVSQEW